MKTISPYTWEEWDDENLPEVSDVSLIILFGEQRIKPLFVIVEMWDHKNYGRGKREYLKNFDGKERKIIGKYHTSLYTWYLRTGIPRGGVRMSLKTYDLLERAANFFAGL